MTHNRTPEINYLDLTDVTHVMIRKGKALPLGCNFEGPFEITDRVGSSCIKVKLGTFADGQPRIETQHWSNCKPAVLAEGAQMGLRLRRAANLLRSRPWHLQKSSPRVHHR